MGKAILIILLSSGLMFSIVSLNTNTMLEQATSKAVDHHSKIRARNIANSMVGIVLSELSDDNDYRVTELVSKNLLDGIAKYTVTDKNFAGEQLIQISTEATYMGMTQKVIAYTKPDPGSSTGPPFFDYAVLAGDKFVMNGQDNIVEDDGNPLWNASTHSNNETNLNGSNYLQEGFVTYTNSITANWGDVTITPNQNPDSDPVHSIAPMVTIPEFSASSYKDKAHEEYSGDKSYSGTITLGTKDNPKIIYVGGKLFIEGTVEGYGIFIVQDDIEITGNLLLDTPDPEGSKLALYTNKKVMMNYKNTEVHAQVLAMEEVILNEENIDFHGSITSKMNVTFNGLDVNFNYKPASTALMEPFWTVTTTGGSRLSLLYYNEQ
jgi:hypothetical protein